jgi:GLPGLI family protein
MEKSRTKTSSMKYLFHILLLPLSLAIRGQQVFIDHGKIEYEFRINVHKQMEGDWAEEFKDKIQKFKTTYFNLFFKGDITVFEKGRDSDDKEDFWDEGMFTHDIVYSDLNSNTFIRRQQVFEQPFLLSDSIRKVQWRITGETREIAGFECHKAVGRLLDSIYVVAFYCEDINVSGGPLSFCQLPGMILGLAIPRMAITMFATKLELTEPTVKELSPPTKGKKTNYAELQTIVNKTVDNWGDWGRKYKWQMML